MNTTPQNTPFKQTEIGPIPQDWEVKKLGDIAVVKTGPFGSSLHEKDYVNNGTPIITVEHLGELGIVHENMPMVSDFDKKRLSAYSLQTNDIVFSRVGSVDRNSIVSEKEEGWLFSGRLLRIRINVKNISPKYLSYYFHQESTKQRIKSVAVGQTMPSLNTQILNKIDIVLPPTKAEQTAIATALSDADALIGSLEKLIHKKRLLKQATMQHLLTPKEDWEVKKLGEIAEVKSGKRLPLGTSLTDKETLHPYIRIVDMYQGGVSVKDIKYVPEDVYTYIKNYRIYKEDIFISVAGTLGIVGRIPEVLDGANLTENANKLTDIKCDVDYLLVVLKSDLIQSKIESERTLGAQPKLALTRIRNFDIPIPPKAEQTRIATILSDMDAELSGLEAKLEKYRQLKQGMMQQLLTGKIRLV